MGARKLHLVCVIAAFSIVPIMARTGLAQTGVMHDSGDPQAAQPPADAPALYQSAPTLEVPPRLVAPPPPPPSTQDQAPDNAASSGTGALGSPSDYASANSTPKRPYLGLSIQYIQSDSTPGRDVRGLEVVSLDPNSPAERAGLRARGSMTELGASGATAGNLLPPLDLVFMPLLKKSGQLGLPGDLIIAIDDKRIEGEVDLQDALDSSKPGDTIYFTIVRSAQDGSHETMKIPVKLGDPGQVVENASVAASSATTKSGGAGTAAAQSH